MVRALLIALALVTLQGCAAATTGPGLFAVGLATFINTKMSLATGQDCSSLKYSKGEGYCQPPEGSEAAMAENAGPATPGTYVGYGPYCYRTLGKVTCYKNQDPLASEYARLN